MKTKIGDQIKNWIIIENDKKPSHWKAQCSLCGCYKIAKKNILRIHPCTCQKSTVIGDNIGLWKIKEKSPKPAHWIAECSQCGNIKTKRKHEFRKYTCKCQGYEKRKQNVASSKYVILKDGTRTPKCLLCGKYWGSVFTSRNKEVELKHASKGLCRGCSRKGEYRQLEVEEPEQNWKNSFISEELEKLLLPNEVDIYKLSYGSSVQIKHKCDVCNVEKETPFKLFVKNKNLSHPKCKSVKTKRTNLKRYGVENHLTSEEYRRQTRKKMLKKYGVGNPLHSDEIKEKSKQTNLKKYGVENPFQSKKVQEKQKNTMIEKYGVRHYNQLPSERNKLNEWCEANPDKLYTSKGEQQLLDWIRTYYPNARKHRQEGHEIDVFIPEINLGIEYNGLFYHDASSKNRTYHLKKTQYYEANKIRLIHIWEHEWKNRQHQVQSFILSAIGKNSIRLNPRNCKIIWSSDKKEIKAAHNLLDDYHIQGHVNTTKFVTNVYYQDQLVATATFGKHHRNSTDWVLSRFCAKMNYTVRGLLGKVSKIAFNNLQVPLISWADYRLSQGNGYQKAGWVQDKLLPPDYFYHKSGCKVISKQARQKKKVNTPEGMTEYQHAKIDGLERVYDCGKIRFIYSLFDKAE